MAQKRIIELDVIRATAIALMIFVHVFVFIYNRDLSFSWANTVSNLGGHICFTLFLFAAGGTIPILLNKYDSKVLRRKFIQRAVVILIFYYLLSLLRRGVDDWFGILTFQEVPGFVDFFTPFVLYFLLVAWLLPYLKDKINWWWLAIGVVLYAIGYGMYYVSVPDWLMPLKSHLFGDTELHRFPIFQYAIVYIAGIVYVYYRQRIKSWHLILATILSWMAYYLAVGYWRFYRWTPTPTFLLYGFNAVGILLLSGELLQTWPHVYKYLILVSKEAFGALIIHTALLFTLDRLFSISVDLPLFMLGYIIVLVVSIVGSRKLISPYGLV